MKPQKNHVEREGSFSLIFRELSQISDKLSTTPNEITVSELDEINRLREAVIETTQPHIIYRSST